MTSAKDLGNAARGHKTLDIMRGSIAGLDAAYQNARITGFLKGSMECLIALALTCGSALVEEAAAEGAAESPEIEWIREKFGDVLKRIGEKDVSELAVSVEAGHAGLDISEVHKSMRELEEIRHQINELKDAARDLQAACDQLDDEKDKVEQRLKLCHDTDDYKRWFRKKFGKEPPPAFPPKPPPPETYDEREAREAREREEAAFDRSIRWSEQ